MADPKWTPGPWYEVKFWDGRRQIRATVGHREVVVANDVSPNDVPLILAAHDLREACEWTLQAIDDASRELGAVTQGLIDAMDLLESVLRKARGEEEGVSEDAAVDEAEAEGTR